MENNNTQPQAFYTKMPSAVGNSSGNNSTSNNNFKSSSKKKKDRRGIFAVVGLLFFIIIALTGVFIAQKQITKTGEEIKTVAPTAPESKPKASTDNNNNCVTVFSIPKGDAICESKIAQEDFTVNGEPLLFAEPGSFNVGDTFIFSITVTASDDTDGDVIVRDVLPSNLLFIEDPDNTPGIQIGESSPITLDVNLGEMTKDQTIKVEFMVEVISTETVASTNSAKVITNSTTPTESICSYSYDTSEGTAECISKEMYNGDPDDENSELIPAGSALNRGENYVYYITVNATNKTNGEVKVHDMIPDGLEFVEVLPGHGYEEYITNEAGENEILANLGVLENEEVTLGFVVKVVDQPELGDLTNSALIYIYPPASEEDEPLATGSICEVDHSILPIGTAQCIEKEAFENFDGTEIEAGEIVDPGQEFIYKISVQADGTTTGNVVVIDELSTNLIFVEDPDNTEGVEYDSDTREVSFDYGIIEDTEIKILEFKVQVIASPIGDTIDNLATITTDEDTSHVCEITLLLEEEVEEEYACNESCTTNEECQSVNVNYICHDSTIGFVCRLDDNLESTTCELAGISTPTPTPVVTPAPGCNDLCSTNADCSNNSHVCTTTDDGSNRCRLDNYPDSETCTPPTVSTEQPVLPETLPETGPADWLNWLKAGMVTLGVGTALLLLL